MAFERRRSHGPPVPTAASTEDGSEMRKVLGLAGVFGMLVVYLIVARPLAHPPVSNGDDAIVASSSVANVDTTARPFMGQLDSARDDTDPDAEDDAYRALIGFVKILSPEEIEQRAVEVSAHDLVEHPELYRGRFVRATGVLITPLGMRRLDKNPAGIDYAYRGFLADPSGENAYCFDVIDRPPEIEPRVQGCRVIGVFLKVARYETKFKQKPTDSGDETTRRIPFLIAKQLVEVKEIERPFGGMTTLLVATFVFASLPLIGIWIASLIRRKKEGEFAEIVNKVRGRRQPLPGKKPGFPGATVTVLGEGTPAPAATPPAATPPAPPSETAPPSSPPSEPPASPPTSPPPPPGP